jgi:hypothetical protein
MVLVPSGEQLIWNIYVIYVSQIKTISYKILAVERNVSRGGHGVGWDGYWPFWHMNPDTTSFKNLTRGPTTVNSIYRVSSFVGQVG